MAPKPPETLLEGDVRRQLNSLWMPLLVGMMAFNCSMMAGTLYISRLGTESLAALGFVIPVIMLFMGVTLGMGVGTASYLARIYGESDRERFRQAATDAVALSFLLTTVVSFAGQAFIDIVFPAMGAGPELMPLIRAHMRVWLFVLPFTSLLFIGNACIRATGNLNYAPAISVIVATLELALSPFFIFGWAGLPAMGLTGAAVGVLLAYAATSLAGLVVLSRRYQLFSHRLRHPALRENWRRIMQIALPAILTNQIPPISAAVVTWFVASLGKEAVAALGIASRIETTATIFFYAFSGAVIIFAGQNFGAGNYGRIREAVKRMFMLCMLSGALMAALLWGVSLELPRLFTDDLRVAPHVAQYLVWVPVSFGAMGCVVVANAVFNAMGMAFSASFLVIARVAMMIGLLFAFSRAEMGFLGIVLSLLLTNLLAGGVAAFWLWRRMP